MDDGRESERTAESDGHDHGAGRNRSDEPDASGEDDERDGSDGAGDGSPPVAVGDGRQKHVHVLTRTGEHHEHGNVYLKHSSVAFIVSPDPSFPDDGTIRYEKATLSRVEVTQHHAACFITTAAADEGPALDALREFRDASLVRSSPGRALVAGYEAVSPPIAATLARHPEATTTRLVRRLVRQCGALARRRKHTSPPVRAVLTTLLVALYVCGMGCAALGHLSIRLRERR
jgi:subtilisin